MPHPVSLLPALVAAAVAALAAVLLAPVPSADAAPRRAAAEVEPLQVTIDGLTPSTLPRQGPVRVSGTVTNVDDETWATVNLYPFVFDTPMTTAAELAEASVSDPGLFVGERITDPGPYYTVEELAPGESAAYSFEVPRRRLAAAAPGIRDGSAGVYWFGVHALGESAGSRDYLADGRARTFLPLVPEPSRNQVQQTVDAALVIPIRHAVRHLSDGRISGRAQWTQTLSTDGQLRRLVDFGAAAGDRPVSWLVDPAVTDAAVRLAAGNPPRSLGPTVEPGADESGSPSPSDGASADSDGDADGEPVPETGPRAHAAAAAGDWLERAQAALEGNELLSLPYGDLDVAGAASHDAAAYRTARKRSGDGLAPWGLTTSPAVASPSGYVSPETLGLVDRSTTVLASDQVFGDRAATAPTVAQTGDDTLVVTSAGAAEGGPGPSDPFSPVAVRQRIVSEAALRLLSPGRRALVTVLPTDWAPASSVGFFDGLDLDWLRLTTVGEISQRSGREVSPERLVYPEAQREAELGSLDFAAARALASAGATLQNLLTLNDRIGGVVTDESLTDVSYASRREPMLSRASAAGSQAWIEDHLRSVKVEGPKAVILSSGSGRFSVTVTNDLEEPVSVRLDAITDPKLEVSVPRRTLEVASGSRSSVLLNAASGANGVRNVRLVLTDTDGTPIGSADSLPIRSNQVSNVIWLILGTGVALLFATIVVRLVRRIRTAART